MSHICRFVCRLHKQFLDCVTVRNLINVGRVAGWKLMWLLMIYIILHYMSVGGFIVFVSVVEQKFCYFISKTVQSALDHGEFLLFNSHRYRTTLLGRLQDWKHSLISLLLLETPDL